jgi:synapsin
LDILAVDALHSKDGKDYIIELNDSAIGMLTEHWLEESTKLAQMIINRMNEIYVK